MRQVGPRLEGRQGKNRLKKMASNLPLCVMLMALALAEEDFVQGADTKTLTHNRRAAVEERCQNIRRDCIATGDLFKRSVVCAGGGKRFINECALQIRSCDLLLDTGEEILQERCFWVVQEEEPGESPVTHAPTTVGHSSWLPPLITLTRPSPKIAVDYAYRFSAPQIQTTTRRPSTYHWDSSPPVPQTQTKPRRESTYHWDSSPVPTKPQTTPRRPSTHLHYHHWHSSPVPHTQTKPRRESTYHWDSTPVPTKPQTTPRRPSTHLHYHHWHSSPVIQQTTRRTTTNPSTVIVTTPRNERSTNFQIDNGGIRFSPTVPSLHAFPAFTTGESGGFRPPPEVNFRDCCRGDTPCASCLPGHKRVEVCGSNGKTYDDECALDRYACSSGEEDLHVKSMGSCKKEDEGHDDAEPPRAPPRGDLGKR